MGIDARIMFKVRGEKPSDAQIAEWSWNLANSIGAQKFFLDSDADPPRRAIHLCGDRYRDEGDPEPGKAYYQDGDTVHAADDEWLLEVSLWTRYYGIGYERGDILSICAIAEWIETNITKDVWYGGDSSGVCVERFNERARRKLRAHLYSMQGRDYFAREWGGRPPAPCSLCIPGKPRFSQYGTGPQYEGWHCAGCGKSFETRDGRQTWQLAKEKA